MTHVTEFSPEQKAQLVTFYAKTFRGEIRFDELLMHPTMASRFVQDYVGYARIWGTPENVVMQTLRDALRTKASSDG